MSLNIILAEYCCEILKLLEIEAFFLLKRLQKFPLSWQRPSYAGLKRFLVQIVAIDHHKGSIPVHSRALLHRSFPIFTFEKNVVILIYIYAGLLFGLC